MNRQACFLLLSVAVSIPVAQGQEKKSAAWESIKTHLAQTVEDLRQKAEAKKEVDKSSFEEARLNDDRARLYWGKIILDL